MTGTQMSHAPAFPLEQTMVDQYGAKYYRTTEGLTKRELFAMAAMQSYLAGSKLKRLNIWQRIKLFFTGKGNVTCAFGSMDEIARQSVKMADELLTALV